MARGIKIFSSEQYTQFNLRSVYWGREVIEMNYNNLNWVKEIRIIGSIKRRKKIMKR